MRQDGEWGRFCGETIEPSLGRQNRPHPPRGETKEPSPGRTREAGKRAGKKNRPRERPGRTQEGKVNGHRMV
ncbi:MAG: hypothetical protein PHE06_01530 [Lachnospiraceae bacterium]|nr:hypothetical protein [Lachnospiraceae bacterium]